MPRRPSASGPARPAVPARSTWWGCSASTEPWALIRQWTGQDAAFAQREAEIEKLERLVWDAIYALQKAKLDSEAARLRRAVEAARPACTAPDTLLRPRLKLPNPG